MKRCLVCQKTPADRAHIKSRGSGGCNEPWNIMPLCRSCHAQQHQIGIITFIEKHQRVREYIEANGWEIVGYNQFKRLVRK